MDKEKIAAEALKAFSSKGGKAAAAKLTPAQRRARARKGGKNRWKNRKDKLNAK